MAARWGRIAAILIIALGAAYLAVGLAWVAAAPDWTDFNPGDPSLTLLELLIVLSLPLFVVLAAAIHVAAPVDRRLTTLVALAFMTVFAGLSAGVHFVRLTALRQLESAGGAVPDPLHLQRWPSIPAALDFLAWDFFLGLALLFAAPAFAGGGLARWVRLGLAASGTLCLAGLLGPVTGDLRLQMIAPLGFALLLPITCVPLALLFGRAAQPDAGGDGGRGMSGPTILG